MTPEDDIAIKLYEQFTSGQETPTFVPRPGIVQAMAEALRAAKQEAVSDLVDSLERLVHMAECETIPGPNTLQQARAAIAKARNI